MRIILDPGHGGNSDLGAVNKITTEKVINLEVAFILKKMLEYNGFEVAMTRSTDTAVSLQERCDISNLWKADLFVSIHHNAADGKAKGYEVYCYTGSTKGGQVANLVAMEFDKTQDRRFVGSGLYAGCKKGNYYVLENTNCPAILTEYLFMDSEFEKYNANEEAKAVCNGICNYFGVPIVISIPSPPIQKENESMTYEEIQEQWAKDAIKLSIARGILKNEHDPDEPVTMGTAAAMFNNFYDAIMNDIAKKLQTKKE